MKRRFWFLCALAAVIALPRPAFAWPENDRTANRSPIGEIFYPQWILNVPEHYEFSPLVSNADPQNRHPAQWAGQDWDPAAWPKDWTPERAVRNFFDLRVFDGQYVSHQVPVLELGPTFYKLSDLDRRRALKLVADYTGIFAKGYKMIALRDWYTKELIGNYTEKGMHLK